LLVFIVGMCCCVARVSYVFGIKTDVTNHLEFLDDSEVVYAAGHSVVRLDTETSIQRLIQGGIGATAITAMATSSNKRYTAFAEDVPDRHPCITFFDWSVKRKKKVINTIDFGSKTIHSMKFSADGKHLLVLGGAPEWNLLLVHWERVKITARLNNTSAQVRRVGARLLS
jgi:hypothetical protein